MCLVEWARGYEMKLWTSEMRHCGWRRWNALILRRSGYGRYFKKFLLRLLSSHSASLLSCQAVEYSLLSQLKIVRFTSSRIQFSSRESPEMAAVYGVFDILLFTTFPIDLCGKELVSVSLFPSFLRVSTFQLCYGRPKKTAKRENPSGIWDYLHFWNSADRSSRFGISIPIF